MHQEAPSKTGRFIFVQAVTLSRVPLAVVFACTLLVWQRSTATLAACTALLVLIELSDLLDGLLSRRLGVASEWGATLDPYADSVSRLLVYWGLSANGLTFLVLPLVMAIRDVTVAYCRIIWTRNQLSVGAQWSGKIKAVVQGVGAFLLLYAPSLLPVTGPWAMPVVSWAVLIVTAASAVEYVAKTVRTACQANPQPGR